MSISGHHPETWQPSWSIRTALLALIAFMPTPGNGKIGSLDYNAEERQKLAKRYLTGIFFRLYPYIDHQLGLYNLCLHVFSLKNSLK